ncbi:MAG: proline dehydrogenase family protein [Tepidamorphaceae bacterium]
MGRQFVLGQTIKEALETSRYYEQRGFRHSYDMLGEAAMTEADAQRYLKSYHDALKKVAAHAKKYMPDADVFAKPSISVKLSAIHPRYEEKKPVRAMTELLPRLKGLCTAAIEQGIAVTVDAEETDRLDLSLDLIEALLNDKDLAGWNGLGLAVQAYGKRAHAVIDWLAGRGAAHRSQGPRAAGQGRLLGHRDQARAGSRSAGFPGLYPQAIDGRVLSSPARASS